MASLVLLIIAGCVGIVIHKLPKASRFATGFKATGMGLAFLALGVWIDSLVDGDGASDWTFAGLLVLLCGVGILLAKTVMVSYQKVAQSLAEPKPSDNYAPDTTRPPNGTTASTRSNAAQAPIRVTASRTRIAPPTGSDRDLIVSEFRSYYDHHKLTPLWPRRYGPPLPDGFIWSDDVQGIRIPRTVARPLKSIARQDSSPTVPRRNDAAAWDKLRRDTYARYGHACANCGRTDRPLHAHHIVPRSLGGYDSPMNLVALCEDCHKLLHPHMRD